MNTSLLRLNYSQLMQKNQNIDKLIHILPVSRSRNNNKEIYIYIFVNERSNLIDSQGVGS